MVAVRGCPRGCVACALCAPQTVYVYSCTLWLYCTLSALRRVLFRVSFVERRVTWCLCHSKSSAGEFRAQRSGEAAAQRWPGARRRTEGLEPSLVRALGYLATTLGPSTSSRSGSIAPKRSRAMRWCDVRRILSTAHRRPRARVGCRGGNARQSSSAREREAPDGFEAPWGHRGGPLKVISRQRCSLLAVGARQGRGALL